MTARVLHVGKYFPPTHGGMETFLCDLIHAQRAFGIDASALVHGTPLPDDPPWIRRVAVKRTLLYTPISPGFRTGLAAAIRCFRPDVLHLHLPNPSAFWALTLPAARQIPWVVHWHSDVLGPSGDRLFNAAHCIYRPLEQALLAQAERIIVTSPPYLDASEPLSAWQESCQVIPLGLDLSRIPLPAELPDPDPWPRGMLRLISVGRLAHYKGFETLIRAVNRTQGVHLVIVGEGESRADLEHLVNATTTPGEAPRVTFQGSVPDARKWRLLASAEVFCLASRERTEAFGLAVLEAMSLGKPCLVSDLPGSGLPWLIRSSEAGQTVPLDDVDAWSRAIEAFCGRPERARAMGRAAREAVLDRFDIRVCQRHIAELYRGLDVPVPVETPPLRPLMVIPAYNEVGSIAGVIRGLLSEGWEDIVVIDDQSTDETVKLASEAGATVLTLPLRLGAWGAIQTGIRYALAHGYRQVVTLDADGQHEPAHVRDLLEAGMGSDVVIGACPERGSILRKVAWRYFRAITGFGIDDITSGFRCYNGDACRLLAGVDATLFDYQDVGVLLLLRANGMEISEVPVDMRERGNGHSRIFLNWWRVARYMAESTLLCFARWSPRHYGGRS